MNCKYHTHKKALWHCPQCDIPFCIDCCDLEQNQIAPRCLLCRSHLESYAVSDVVEPFWNKVGQFNRYPWQKNALNFLGIFMGFAFVVGLINGFISIWILNLVLKLTLLSIGVGYVFGVLNKVARGDFAAPTYDEITLNNSDNLTVKVIGLYIILVLLGIFMVSSWQETGYYLLVGSVGFFMPAMMINLAMSKHLSTALNPIDLVRTVAGIGWPYMLLVLFVYLIGLGLEFALSTIHFWLPEFLSYPLIYGALAYFYIIMFSMLGYVVYQYHAELGYGIDADRLINNENVQQDLALRKLAHADVYIQEGRFDDAEAVLYEVAKNPQHSAPALERLIKLNIARNNPVATIKAARAFFDMADLDKHAPKALALYQEVEAFEPRFKPMHANARAVLIGAIRNPKLLPLVEKLSSDMPEKLAKDPQLPLALLAEAKFYAEVVNNDDKAIELLQNLLNQFPHGKHQLEAERLLGVCRSMQHSFKANR